MISILIIWLKFDFSLFTRLNLQIFYFLCLFFTHYNSFLWPLLYFRWLSWTWGLRILIIWITAFTSWWWRTWLTRWFFTFFSLDLPLWSFYLHISPILSFVWLGFVFLFKLNFKVLIFLSCLHFFDIFIVNVVIFLLLL